MTDEVLRAPHVLEFPYKRSVGPIVGGFLTALRDGRLVGARGSGGRVIVPPTEYDPETGEDVDPDLVEVGPSGTVTAWAWTDHPYRGQPLDRPFAWALVRPDGADTALLHVVAAPSADEMETGMRVIARFRTLADRVGAMADLECFVPVPEGGA